MMKLYSTIGLLAATCWLNAQAQGTFPVLDKDFYNATNFSSDLNTVVLPASPVKYDAIFIGGVHEVYDATSNKTALAKENQDFTGYIPFEGRSDSGYVIVNHETNSSHDIIGDGGGMTVFTVWHNPTTKKWEVVADNAGHKYRNVYFGNVGATFNNCGGIQTNWGKVFTAEERTRNNNAGLLADGIRDTSDIQITVNGTITKTVKKWETMGYIVEVDPATAMAEGKNYNMGRYSHEGGWIAADERTVYLSDDNSAGSPLYKFVAEKARDFSKGQLSVWKETQNGAAGEWIPLDMSWESMVNATDSAYAKGASVFARLEWVQGVGEYVYITETGRANSGFNFSGAVAKGATLPKHLRLRDMEDGLENAKGPDRFGRVLRLEVSTGKIDVLIEGGGEANGDDVSGNHLISPDGLATTTINGRTYLVINEDANAGGLPYGPAQFSDVLNEIYWLDITNDASGTLHSVSELKRFLAGPKGCETTGGRFTPDGKTYFVNIQHPSSDNIEPFNHSTTIAITGFEEALVNAVANPVFESNAFSAFPNPVSRELTLSKKTDGALYDSTGKQVDTFRNSNSLDVSKQETGVYFIKTKDNEVLRVVIE